MSAYVEVPIKGGRLVLVDAGSIAALVYPKGGDADALATLDDPMTLVLRGGETLPPIFGLSPRDFMIACAYVRIALKRDLKRDAIPVVILKWSELLSRVAEFKRMAGED